MEKNNKETKTLAYYLGQAFVATIGISAISIIVALTMKFILWLA